MCLDVSLGRYCSMEAIALAVAFGFVQDLFDRRQRVEHRRVTASLDPTLLLMKMVSPKACLRPSVQKTKVGMSRSCLMLEMRGPLLGYFQQAIFHDGDLLLGMRISRTCSPKFWGDQGVCAANPISYTPSMEEQVTQPVTDSFVELDPFFPPPVVLEIRVPLLP
jgi:hypothetical protein